MRRSDVICQNPNVLLYLNLTHLQIASLELRWSLLFYYGAPRSNYILRTVPPPLCSSYKTERDKKIRNTLAVIMALDESICEEAAMVSRLHMPAKLGGLGLSSASFVSPSAYWASWADCFISCAQSVLA